MDAKENRRERGREGRGRHRGNPAPSTASEASVQPRLSPSQASQGTAASAAAPSRAQRKRNSLLEEQCLPASEKDRVVGWGLSMSLSVTGVLRRDKGQPHLQVRFKAVGPDGVTMGDRNWGGVCKWGLVARLLLTSSASQASSFPLPPSAPYTSAAATGVLARQTDRQTDK